MVMTLPDQETLCIAVQDTVRLADGTPITIRPIQPDDGPALQRFHSRLSETTVYYRFFECVPKLTDTLAAYFTHLDGINRCALVALDPANPDEIIGVVRYDRLTDMERAEYAIVIEDRWQHHGLGMALTWRLIARARAHGIRTLEAVVLPGNWGMINLFKHLELPMQIAAGPELLIRIALDPPTEPALNSA